MTKNAKYIRTRVQLQLTRMLAEGHTVTECFTWLFHHLRDERELKQTLEKAGLSKNCGRRMLDGTGVISLTSAELIADAVGMKLTMEAKE